MLKPMTLAEVEQCKECFLLYDPDDPVVYQYRVGKILHEFIQFERDINGWAKSQPHLWKDCYTETWAAFKTHPEEHEIKHWKRRMYG